MAAFKEHIKFSSLFGIGYAGSLVAIGVPWPQSVIAGLGCGLAGMLPDLDSDSGRPVKALVSLTAALVPLLLLPRMQQFNMPPHQTILILVGFYIGIRFGLSWLFKRMTVHRGMFHSIPAAIIAAEIVFLAHHCPSGRQPWTLAIGVFIGFVSHLILDEIYSIDSMGRPKKSAGTAIKLFSQNTFANLTAYTLLATLTYVVAMDLGYARPLELNIAFQKEPVQQQLFDQVAPVNAPQ